LTQTALENKVISSKGLLEDIMGFKRKIIARVASFGLIVSLLLSPLAVYAFSGYGSGTQSIPYRISTCAQLGEMANNLAGHYVLNNNIDCNNTTFTSVGGTGGSTPFTGTLDGQGHTIKNINFNGCGIFCSSNGATIENLTLSNGTYAVGSSSYNGSFVGFADSTQFTNLHSSISFNGGNFAYIGGILGFGNSADVISNSSFSGSISVTGTDGYNGGIVGFIWDSGDLVTNSYFNGSLSLGGSTTIEAQGGIAGGENAGSITKSYSTGTLHDTAGSSNGNRDGGLVGTFSGGSVSNSFTASAITSTGSNTGAAFGDGLGTSTNNYYDKTAVGLSVCSGLDSAACTAVNNGNTSPNYFFNNTISPPLNTWDFSSAWLTTSASYPALRNQAAFTAASGIPNGGDSNNDGTTDSYQANVVNAADDNNVWTTVVIPSGNSCMVGSAQAINAGSLKADTGYNALNNPVDFSVYCASSGATVPITIIYDRQYANPTLRFYNPTTGSYTAVSGAQFSTVTIGGIARTKVTYNATDGGAYDSDGTANGVIADPVGLAAVTGATTTPTAPDTGFGMNHANIIWPLITFSSISTGLIIGGLLLRKYPAK
jgi:hypothetical protein